MSTAGPGRKYVGPTRTAFSTTGSWSSMPIPSGHKVRFSGREKLRTDLLRDGDGAPDLRDKSSRIEMGEGQGRARLGLRSGYESRQRSHPERGRLFARTLAGAGAGERIWSERKIMLQASGAHSGCAKVCREALSTAKSDTHLHGSLRHFCETDTCVTELSGVSGTPHERRARTAGARRRRGAGCGGTARGTRL